MPSPVTHAVAALALTPAFFPLPLPKRVCLVGALCSALPDMDVVGFSFGVRYGDFWGHRGFTHSLVFAALLALLLAALPIFREPSQLPPAAHPRLRIMLYLFVATASHGFLDAMTNGGLGVALLTAVAPAAAEDAAPVDNRSGTVRIYVSLATSAMTRLVAAMNRHFPNLKIEFVRAGSVETVRRSVLTPVTTGAGSVFAQSNLS